MQMSNFIRDSGERWKSMGYYLTEKMYVNGKSRNERRNLTNEEMWNLLEDIRKECFTNYEEISKELGW